MPRFLQKKIVEIKQRVLAIGTLCEEQTRDALKAVATRDVELAERVIVGDKEIDIMEIDLEEECLNCLALHQPVAFDLRYVVAVLKMNNDLERIGDLAKSLAGQARALAGEAEAIEMPFDLRAMGLRVERMLRYALDSVVNIDVEQAREVRVLDDEVDIMHAGTYRRAAELMREHPHQIEQMIHYLNVSRQLERIADHACNVAKDVLYITEGEIPRHRRLQKQRDAETADGDD